MGPPTLDSEGFNAVLDGYGNDVRDYRHAANVPAGTTEVEATTAAAATSAALTTLTSPDARIAHEKNC